MTLRGGEPLDEIFLVEFVHEKADGAAMHAVDRLAGIHEALQGRQHQAVAAERDDDVGLVRRGVAIALDQAPARALRHRRVAGDEGDALEAGAGRALGHGFRSGRCSWARRNGPRGGKGEDSMERAVFVYTTYPSIVEAEHAGRTLVERRLCACVNILPGMVSYYRWQGAVERGDEIVMIIKTRAGLAEAVRAAVKEMHSYTTPAILVIPIEHVDPDYHAWIVGETAGAKG